MGGLPGVVGGAGGVPGWERRSSSSSSVQALAGCEVGGGGFGGGHDGRCWEGVAWWYEGRRKRESGR